MTNTVSACVIVAALLALLFTPAAQRPSDRNVGERAYSARRPDIQTTREWQVKEALAGFVRGVRYGSAPLVRSWYRVQPAGSAGVAEAVEVEDDCVERFVERLSRVGGEPVIQIVNPRISWRGAQATVECVVIWDFSDDRGRRFYWTTSETFVLWPDGSRYTVAGASTTPRVFRHAHDSTDLGRMIQDVPGEP